MKKVVVTGATGMIASALIRKLIKEEVDILAIVRPNSAKMGNIPQSDRIRLVECDVNNLLSLKETLQDTCDVFYHFAWNGTFGDSRNDAYLQNNNIKNTLEAVELAAHLGCKMFVGAGSQAEYGRVTEKLSYKTPTNPENGYGIAKYTAGKLSRLYAEQLGMKHVWTRILSVYGPGDNKYTLTMSTIMKLLKGEHAAFTKGEQVWDLLYCDDAATAFYLIGENGKHGSVYTLGSGQTKYLYEFITMIRDAIDPDVTLGIGEIPYAKNQVMQLCADITQLTKDTGFSPNISFEDGIQHTITWCKEHYI